MFHSLLSARLAQCCGAALLLVLAPLLAQAAVPLEAAMCLQLDPGELSPSPDDKMVLTADKLVGERDGLSDLAGAVQLRLGTREFIGDAVQYDNEHRRVFVNSKSRFRNDAFLISSEKANFDLNSEIGMFDRAHFTLLQRGARGTADEMVVSKNGEAQLTNVSYTSCSPGNNAWELSASRVKLDQDKGLGSASNAIIRLGSVPILYVPYLQFPLDDQRRSGFLFPTFSNDSRSGFDFRWPLYLNLAPNYDAIFTPRELSSRGVQLGLSGRYLLPHSQGHANFEYLPIDRLTGQSRGLTDYFHEGLINNRLSLEVRYAEASDPHYFEDLANRTAFSSLTHLERSVHLIYQSPASFTLQALVQDFHPLASAFIGLDEPYRRLPEVRFDSLSRKDILGARFGLSAQAVHFARSDDSVRGMRAVVQPFVRWNYDTGAFHGNFQTDVNHTAYQLDNVTGGGVRTPQRTLPLFSAETGLRFERLGSDGALQLLEPRIAYLYVPFRNQSALPVFDSGQLDFDLPQLFARNRFSGYDRIADANQITTALTWRVLDSGIGTTRLAATLGQIYRLTESRVSLPGFSAPDAGSSDYLADLEFRISQQLSATSTLQWSPDSGRFKRTGAALRYRQGGIRADLAYRFRSGLLEQTDASFSAPISAAWRVAGRVRQSLRDNRTLDALAGLEYETCCWALRTSYRRFLINSAGEFNSGVFLQLELKGLTRLGAGFDTLLPGDNRPLGDN